jgi:hypothetical protein
MKQLLLGQPPKLPTAWMHCAEMAPEMEETCSSLDAKGMKDAKSKVG